MKKIINLNEKYVPIKDLTGGNVNVDNDISTDNINSYLINDLKTVSQQTGIKIQITSAKSDHGKGTKSGNVSRHYTNQAVDIARLNGQGSSGASNGKNGSAQFRDNGNKIKDALVKLGYKWNSEGKSNPKAVLWQTNTGGNHFNHLHVSNTSGEGSPPIDSGSSDTSSSVETSDNVKITSTNKGTSALEGGIGLTNDVLNNLASTASKNESSLSESVKDEINIIKRLM